MHMSEVVAAVVAQPYYAPLFREAYSNTEVNKERITECISNFINAMGSYQSKFDQEASRQQYGTDFKYFAGFNAEQNRGLKIYQEKCASCHSPIMGRPMLFLANNGLDAVTSATDGGVGMLSGVNSERGCFKVPTLRNIALTGPYMHDGRFATLEEVVEHYNSGIQSHVNLHPNLMSNGQPKRMNFTNSDKQDLITFLNTLTDEIFKTDEKFADPFK